jgi:PAS domain S-box-containing protein
MTNSKRSKGQRILIVDDEPLLSQMVAEALHVEGYEPTACTHPQEALESFEKGAFSLAFVDINLPEMSGLELASMFKELDPAIEIVFMTGYGTFDNAVQAIKIGAYDYLNKPFGINEVRLCLKRFQERQALREHIRLSEQRHFDLVQNVPCIIFVIHNDLRLDFINRASEGMLGYAPEDAMGDPQWLKKIIHPNDFRRVKKVLVSSLESDSSRFSIECRLIHKQGHFIHAIIKSISLTEPKDADESGRLQGLMVDISDRVYLEKTMLQEENLRTLGDISAEVAHEIRNPLVSIGGFARRLQKKFPELPESAIILRESKRLETILQKIIEYLQPMELVYQDCSINDIVSECVSLLEPDLKRKNVRCQLNFDPSLPSAHIDKDIFAQIVTGLILTATHQIYGKGVLKLRTFESGGNIQTEFRYQCPKPMGLEQFFSSDEGYQEMGLPLSKRLLRHMGGLLSFFEEQNEMIFTISLSKTAKSASQKDRIQDP